MLTLDPTNRRILDELARDCRMSFQKLAGKVGLSTTAVIRRVSSLIEDGTIMKFRVIPSRAMTGVSKFAAIVHTDGTENADDLVDLIGTNRGVIQVSELITTAGRSYFVTGEFIGSKRLQEIRRSLRSLDSARNVEIHATIRTMVPEGTRMDVSRHQLLVLRALRKDARMQMRDISENSGLSLKRTRKVLREIRESGAFRFSIRISHTFARGIDLVLKIQFDENATSNQEVCDWLREEFPGRIYDFFQSATEPVLFAWFEPDDIREACAICKTVRQRSSINSATPLVFLSHKKFPWLGEFLLDEMIQEIE